MQHKTQDQGSGSGSGSGGDISSGCRDQAGDCLATSQQMTTMLDVSHDEEPEKRNSELQLAWSDAVDEDLLVTSKAYKVVQVLMLSWEESVDDMDVKSEIGKLTEVFRDYYNFGVTHKTIKKRENKMAQPQVNSIVANWVDEHDGLKTLLIVYFAGHGNGDGGNLHLSGYKQTPGDTQRYLNSVVWDYTEKNLLEIQSDVLQIFDCCYAGTIGRGDSHHTVQYLAACGPNDTTPRPGDSSFTMALIWALKELHSRRFTTSQLKAKIEEAPDFKKSQKPLLRNRHETTGNECIVLHPLQKDDSLASELSQPATEGLLSPERPSFKFNVQQEVVTLKFVFESTVMEEDIKKLGKSLGYVIKNHRLNVSGISWGGVRPRRCTVNQVVSCFQSVLERRKSVKRNRTPQMPGPTTSDFKGSLTVQANNMMVLEQAHRRPNEGNDAEYEIHAKVRRLEKHPRDLSPY